MRAVDEHDLKNATAIYDFVMLYIEWAKRHPNKIMMPVDTTADAVTLTHQGTVRQVPSGSKFNEIIRALTRENNIIALNVTEMYKDVHAIATSFLTQTSHEWTHRSDSAVFDVTREFAFPWARRYELLTILFPSVEALAQELVHFPQVINAQTAVLARVPEADRATVTVLTAGQLLDLLTRNLQTTIAIEYTSSILLQKQQPAKPPAKAPRTGAGASPASSAGPHVKQFVAHALQPSGTFTTFIDASLPGNGKTMMNVLHVTHALATQDRRLAALLKMQEKGAVTVFYPMFYPIVIIATGSAFSQFRDAVQQMAASIKEQYGIVVKVADATKGFSLKKYKSQGVGQPLRTLTFAIICQENLVLDVLMAQPDGVTLPPVVANSSRRQVAVGEILFGGILVDEGVDMGRRILRHATNQALYTGWILATPKQMFSKHSAALAENLLLRENGKLFAPDRLLQNFKQKNWDEITGPLSSWTELVSMILPLAADHMKLKELCPLRPDQLLISAVATGVIDTLQRCFKSGAQISYQRPGIAALLREMCQQHVTRAEPALKLLEQICTPNADRRVLLHLPYHQMTSIMHAEFEGNVIGQCLLKPMTWSGLRGANKSVQRLQSKTTPSCWIEESARPPEWRDLPLVTSYDAKKRKTFIAVAVLHDDATAVVMVPLQKTNDPNPSAAKYSPIMSMSLLKLGHDLVHVSDPTISTLSQLPLMNKLYKTVTGKLATQCAFCGSPAEAFTVCCGVCCCTACTTETSCMLPIANPHPESSERWVESGCKMCLPARFSFLTVSESDDRRLALHYSQSKCVKLLEDTNKLRGKPIPATLYDVVCKLNEHGFRRVLVVTPEPDREDSLHSYMREACDAFNSLSSTKIDFCPAPNGAAAEAIRQRTQILKKFQTTQTYEDDTVVISTYKGASSLVQGADLFTADALVIISGNDAKDMFKDGVAAFTEAAMQAITRVTRPNVLRKSLPEKQYLPCLLLGFEKQLNASFFNRGESIPHVMAVRVSEHPNGEATGCDVGSSCGNS